MAAAATVAGGEDRDDEDYDDDVDDGPRRRKAEDLFSLRLSELRDFRSIHGHGSIPMPYPPNPPLGVWAANLRRQHALWKRAREESADAAAVAEHGEGDRPGGATTAAPYDGYLTPRRRERLTAAGFDFESLTERRFAARAGELEEFRARHGHCMVPEKWDENPALGAWVSNLRSSYRRMMMMQRRSSKDGRDDEAANGIDDDDDADSEGEKKPRRRTKNILLQPLQRLHRRKKRRLRSPRLSHLDEERIQLLEEMGFVWSSVDRKWLGMLEWAKAYGAVSRELDAAAEDRPLLWENYLKFVSEVQDQSVLTSFHPQDRILALLSEGSGSDNRADRQFLPADLDYRVPPNDDLHYPLRIWMINQRSNYSRMKRGENNTSSSSSLPSTMTDRRRLALEEIHFPWSGRFPNRIEEVRHEEQLEEERERRRERERQKERREREERERVERILKTPSIVATSDSVSGPGEDGGEGAGTGSVLDVMALWDAGDDDDDW